MNVYTVTEFTKQVKTIFGKAFPDTISITGEVSDLTRASSGHIYFTLKDTGAKLRAAFFRNFSLGAGTFIPKNGDKVKVIGDITLYEPDGSYQILVKRVFYDSEGDFWKKFEETKRKLEASGLFDEERKRPIPLYPKRIALITSLSGAAIKDFIVTARLDGAKFAIDVWGVPVQGVDGAGKIASAIKNAGSQPERYDVIVVTRGGGSLDDLAVFNEENVAKAIALSPTPTISAIGHERDITIADFACDKRCATPTAAAAFLSAEYKKAVAEVEKACNTLWQRIVLKIDSMYRRIDFIELKIKNSSPLTITAGYKNRMEIAARSLVFHTKNRISLYKSFLDRAEKIIGSADAGNKINAYRYKIDGLREKILRNTLDKIKGYSAQISTFEAGLKALNPENVLERGYALVYKNGLAVIGVGAVQEKDLIEIKLKDGYINSFVDSIISEDIDGEDTDNS